MINNKIEYTLCSAIHFDTGEKAHVHMPLNIKTGFVICGASHANCFGPVEVLNPELEMESQRRAKGIVEIQGFLTSKRRFVDRKEGGRIAFESGQITEPTDFLFSEQLY